MLYAVGAVADEAAAAIRELRKQCEMLEEVLDWYADQMCEGWCDNDPIACIAIGSDNCAGCPARAVLKEEV